MAGRSCDVGCAVKIFQRGFLREAEDAPRKPQPRIDTPRSVGRPVHRNRKRWRKLGDFWYEEDFRVYRVREGAGSLPLSRRQREIWGKNLSKEERIPSTKYADLGGCGCGCDCGCDCGCECGGPGGCGCECGFGGPEGGPGGFGGPADYGGPPGGPCSPGGPSDIGYGGVGFGPGTGSVGQGFGTAEAAAAAGFGGGFGGFGGPSDAFGAFAQAGPPGTQDIGYGGVSFGPTGGFGGFTATGPEMGVADFEPSGVIAASSPSALSNAQG